MRKNGFTLIELLAVIVILAIIALIATPIILGIINDAREKVNERSVELYASAVRNGIAAYQLREGKEVKAGAYTSETLPFDVEYDGEVECSTIELYEDGGVYVTGCTVNDLEIDYAYGQNQENIVKLSEICRPAYEQLYATNILDSGYKYECDVDPSKNGYDYSFYVLTTPLEGETSINLIMDSNINKSGENVKGDETDLGLVAWYEDELTNKYGPITAMNYLQEATKNWTNLTPMTISSFTDSKGNAYDISKVYSVNARMPYRSEINDYDSETGTYAYLYDNLHTDCYDDEGEDTSCDEATYMNGVFEAGINHIQGAHGYWMLSSDTFNSNAFLSVDYDGAPASLISSNISYRGVRPVINLSI